MDRNNWLLLLLVTGLTGTFFVQSARKPVPVAVATAESKDGQAKDPSDTPTRTFAHPLAEFLGVSALTGGTKSPGSKPEFLESLSKLWPKDTSFQRRLQEEVGQLDFLIYLVADPIDAQANHRFDQQLDVLHKAMAAEKFVPDRFHLPWTQEKSRRLYTGEPGVILYRRNAASTSPPSPDKTAKPRTDLVLVYLIGETATGGIHWAAFQCAVQNQQDLRRLAGKPVSARIQVCGPTFSGSADSLARAIWHSKPAAFDVITGQAISIERDRFRELSGGTRVHSTVLSGDVLKQALIRHVVERNWHCSRIAWLTENGTGYGSSISFFGGGTFGVVRPPEIIEFPFPANIAQVRAAYQEAQRKESKSKETLGPTPLRLSIPLTASGAPADSPPPLTPDLTAPATELIQRQILITIRDQNIKYVGISATDPRVQQ